jgi:hypothetical protein
VPDIAGSKGSLNVLLGEVAGVGERPLSFAPITFGRLGKFVVGDMRFRRRDFI